MSKLSVGDKAPNFGSVNQNGEKVSLKDFEGNKLIVYFYPKDNTPGCTKQACNLRDNYQSLLDNGYKLLGVSPDSEKSHQKFIEKFELPFDLLADTEHEVAEAFGVWVEKNMYGRKYMGIARTTFVIDEKGVISEIISKVKTDNHTDQILN
ncbi:MAG: thioredoxin-dependent thiol peroxidase [Spirosomaceae bacterium]|nr:thioredoxin-dependent thiol peroxidase [Spirosomataceae bacterium]